MRNDALVRIYTKPLFDLAVENNLLDAVASELETLSTLFKQVPLLAEYLDSPNVRRREKLDLLKKGYDKPWTPFFSRFLDLVIRKGRQEILPDAFEAFSHYWDEYRSRLDVTVTSAVVLSDSEKEAISKRLAARTGKNIVLKCNVDLSVMGGIRLQIGHQLLDATISGKLRSLREELLGA